MNTKISSVQHDIPLSPARTKAGRSKYPFKDMKLNSSFEVEAPKGCNMEDMKFVHRLAQTVRAAGRRYGRFTGKRFLVRATADGVRCWRIE